MMLSKYNVNTKSILVAKKISISGEALAKHRQKADLTQKELAEGQGGLGITRVTLAGWEKQKTVEITEKQAKSLETLLSVSIDVLTNVPHETTSELVDLYRDLAAERLERINELKEQVQSLRKELADCKSGGK
jgi:transcriptional regulator with XRE-family HTH domain